MCPMCWYGIISLHKARFVSYAPVCVRQRMKKGSIYTHTTSAKIHKKFMIMVAWWRVEGAVELRIWAAKDFFHCMLLKKHEFTKQKQNPPCHGSTSSPGPNLPLTPPLLRQVTPRHLPPLDLLLLPKSVSHMHTAGSPHLHTEDNNSAHSIECFWELNEIKHKCFS